MKGLSESYEEWRHCITVKCKISLSQEYLAQRIEALSDSRDGATARFVELYGEPHRLRTLDWFKRAQGELGA